MCKTSSSTYMRMHSSGGKTKQKKHVHFNSDVFPRGKLPRLNWNLNMFAIRQPSKALKWIDVKRNKFWKKRPGSPAYAREQHRPHQTSEKSPWQGKHTHTHTHTHHRFGSTRWEAPATQLSLKEAETTANLQFKVKLRQRPVNLNCFFAFCTLK